MTPIAIENFIDNASDAETFSYAQSLEQVKLLAMYKRTYPGYQRFFSRAAGIFGVGRRPKPRAAQRGSL